jgi:hypothetical protein
VLPRADVAIRAAVDRCAPKRRALKHNAERFMRSRPAADCSCALRAHRISRAMCAPWEGARSEHWLGALDRAGVPESLWQGRHGPESWPGINRNTQPEYAPERRTRATRVRCSKIQHNNCRVLPQPSDPVAAPDRGEFTARAHRSLRRW